MRISGKQSAAARELLGITQPELASAAGVSVKTIVRFETGKADPYKSSLVKILGEFERRGIEFTNGTGTGVRLNHAKAAEFARSATQARIETER